MSDAADRRRYPRFDIELGGRISAGPAGAAACVIRDFCQGGLLVQRLPAAAGDSLGGLEAGQTVRLGTKIISSDGERPLSLDADVVWAREQYLGLAFRRPSAAIVDLLQRHERLKRSGAFAANISSSRGEARALSKLRHAAKGELPAILRALMSEVGEALLDKVDQVGSNTERQQVFVDINALEQLRRGDALMQAVLAQAEGGDDADADGAGDGELALVDTDEFERWLEASRAHTLLDRRFSDQLSAIGSRIAGLREAGGGALVVPFEPQHFTGALKQVARELELGATTRGVLFERATAVLGDRLGDFYRCLDQSLDSIGAPEAQQRRLQVVPSPSTPHATVDPARPPDGRPQDEAADSVASGTATAPASVPMAGPGTFVPIDPQLLQQLQENERQQREGLAQDLMVHVADLPNMTESLRGWLSLLQAPLAQQAVADEGFFQNSKHPLREIVDALGHLQMFRATPDAAPGDDPLRQQVSDLLRPISEGASDPATLEAIATAVNDLTLQQSRLYQRNVERVAEASEGRERLRQARLNVVSELNRRYAGKRVPELLPQLLEAGWRAALELSALNENEHRARLEGQLDLTDMLVARLGGDAFEHARDAVSGPDLMTRVCSELSEVAFDPFRRNAVEKRLREELSAGGAGRAKLVEMTRLNAESAADDDRHPPEGVADTTWRQLLVRCDTIQVGDRLRFLSAGGAARELRVAWVRADHRVFVLVDHRGLRVRDIRRAEVALGLHQREIELDQANGQPLSDRAVDAILAQMEERLAHQAAHDSLTGLINRQQFSVALEQALRLPARDGGAGVLLWVDIDQFRLVNEIYGYDTGDRLLIAVARQLEQLQGAKVLGHLGGDRYAVLMPDIVAEDALLRAQAINASVAAMPFDWGGQSMTVTVSIGLVSLAIGNDGSSPLLQAAENALSAAKNAGGNQAYLYREDDPDIARRRESVRWVAQVDEALENGQLHLRCQPIVPVRPGDGLAPHYEVLLGVSSGSDESLPIGEFIDAAERYNRMRSVDRWVTRTVMEWIARHRDHMPALHGFAVNLSGQTASDPGFVEFVRQQFQRTGIDPAWLSFEVTETAAVSDLTSSAGIVHDLKAMGCKIALDDFGSGLASYSYLKELPVDWLKIDGAFVRKIAADRDDYAVVKSINEIGHFLGKKTIAEYVADAEILRLVTEIGVDYAQGFGISPPMLMDELLKYRATA
jgi:diguanylate cyclase (GGDEF)-like protein